MQNNRCMGIKADGHICTHRHNGTTNPLAMHLRFCAIHWRTYGRSVLAMGRHHVEGHCLQFTREGWCNLAKLPDDSMCAGHRAIVMVEDARHEQEVMEDVILNTFLNEAAAREPRPRWQDIVLECARLPHEITLRERIARRYFLATQPNTPMRHYAAVWRWAITGGVGEPPDAPAPPLIPAAVQPPPRRPRNDLGAIANDRQNVHTTAVSNQTNAGLEKLLEAERNWKGQPLRAPEWFASRWLTRGYGTWPVVRATVDDMQGWFTKNTCRTTGDQLYRKALMGLFLRIRDVKDHDMRTELYKRTFEECHESIGMCCDGHISRLCNVMVGFDESFKPPVPLGLLIQNKMSAISTLDIPTEEKIQQATQFFNENSVPEADRVSWLEAF